MTSDAKIGLLLGLVFIFIIAFIINGLPRFRSNTNNNELTTNMVNLQNGSMGIAAKERKAQGVFNRAQRVKQERADETQTSSDNQEKIRFQVPLSGDDPVVEAADDKARINEPSPIKPDLPKIYVVSEGDNLAAIAQKFYGPEKGNKKITIDRIFEANRKLLKSPDDIYVGQKLTIPLLKDKAESVFPKSLFEKVKSISRKLTSSNTLKAPSAKRNRQYVVREGDSLWQIAAEQLGDGTRYEEISELNADILEDEDYLVVEMRLRLPAR
ncbi:MAG: LysM peptidoglycan-binding domain-containing protein [Planctomycetes bacterium]|nr:LysM peptidoglycan-binding domain-containing protein [Planctomycetota bacterium]